MHAITVKRHRRLGVATFFPARHLLPDAIEAILPVWLAADLDEDVAAHEVGYGIGKATLMIQNRGAV